MVQFLIIIQILLNFTLANQIINEEYEYDYDYSIPNDITYVKKTEQSLTSLNGFEKYQKTVKKLDVSFNEISNIDLLSKFTKLTRLYLINNRLIDLNSIEYLKNLKELHASSNRIKNIDKLEGLTKLIVLTNRINRTIGESKNILTILLANNNKIKNINSIENLFLLKHVEMNDNHIENIE